MNEMAADRVTVVAFKGRAVDPDTLGDRMPEAPAVISRQQPVALDHGSYSHETRPRLAPDR